MVVSSAYKKAFDRILSEIEGDKDLLSKHANALLGYATRGDYQGRYAMAGLVPESCWQWPAYNEQIFQPQRAQRQWEVDVIMAEAPTTLLTRLKVDELRVISAGRVKGKSKGELVERLLQIVPVDEIELLTETIRSKLMDDIVNWKPRYEDRCAWFLRRLAMYVFSIEKQLSFKNLMAKGANLRASFMAGNPETTPQQCLAMDGKIVKFDDPILAEKSPCDRLNCSCHWTATASGFEDAPYKSMVKHPEGRQWTNEELRAKASEFAKRKGLSPGKGLSNLSIFTMLRARLKYWIINKL